MIYHIYSLKNDIEVDSIILDNISPPSKPATIDSKNSMMIVINVQRWS